MGTPSKATRHNGAALRYLRIKSGLKTRELAEIVRCRYSHVDNLEHERKEASIEMLYRLASALDVPVAALVRDRTAVMRPGDSPHPDVRLDSTRNSTPRSDHHRQPRSAAS